jgi:hypothetical protein
VWIWKRVSGRWAKYFKDGIKISPVNPVELARELPLPKETKLQHLSSSDWIDTRHKKGNRDWNGAHCGPGDGGKFFSCRRSSKKFGEIYISSQLMERHAVEGDYFIYNIFTSDANWFHHFDTETRQRMEWHLITSPKKKWTKIRPSATRARRTHFEKLKLHIGRVLSQDNIINVAPELHTFQKLRHADKEN